ncbi:MAG: TatD family hydrolase, partial [Tannerella sp.]|nr:TatD family hydrolase [Tannerella sp.]
MHYLDIHTHSIYPCNDGNHTSIISVDIREPFNPVDGCLYSVGIHPWYADASLMPLVRKYALMPQVVAIGETGLDKAILKRKNRVGADGINPPDINLQTDLLRQHALLAEEVRKPLIIHCVKAFNEIIKIKSDMKPALPWIIHGFRSNAQTAKMLLEADFYLSFGVNYQDDALLLAFRYNRLLIETDTAEVDISEVYRRIS